MCAGLLATSLVAGCGAPSGAPSASGTDAQSGSNSAPVILGMSVAPEPIRPGDRCELVCQATDEDGDILTYAWTAGQGDIVGKGAAVEWTAPSTEGLFRVSVMVDDGRGGTDERSISLVVKSNSAPQFQAAPTFTEGVRPGASVSISYPAADADGDEVSYEWHATFGEVRGEADNIVWVAPNEPGSYVITVAARDDFGGETRRDILISVTPGVTLKLGTFVVEAIDHDMLKYDLGVWVIYVGRSCRIECIVLEGDGPFTYAWTVDEGILATDGATATWQAPEVRGPATIKVEVTDAHGNTNAGQVLMYSEDCTCAFN
jgi:hypothetical protein